ncbi:MAG: hypothetical protein RLZZ524_1706, partial [Pseudomonadota bacterium]
RPPPCCRRSLTTLNTLITLITLNSMNTAFPLDHGSARCASTMVARYPPTWS